MSLPLNIFFQVNCVHVLALKYTLLLEKLKVSDARFVSLVLKQKQKYLDIKFLISSFILSPKMSS